MREPCIICRYSDVIYIDERLIDGDSIDSIASDFCLDREDIIRHACNHISEEGIFCYYCKRSMEEKLFMKMVLKGDRFFPACCDCLDSEDYW